MFREVRPGVFLDWHNAPQRRYAIVLDGRAQFTASDGDGPPFRAIFVTISCTEKVIRTSCSFK
jgi:hypothetical protein